MKSLIWVGIIVLVAQVCGCTARRSFSHGDDHYTVTWSANKVSRIECRSERLPGGVVVVRISRGHKEKKVLINDEKDSIWAKTVFKPCADIGSCAGIVFHEWGKHLGLEDYVFREWKLEAQDVLVYRETLVSDEDSGALKRLEFLGPFGIKLEPPR